MTKDELDAIEARCNAATPGPWELDYPNNHRWGTSVKGVASAGGKDVFNAEDFEFHGQRIDFDFVIHARQDIPALLAEVRRLKRIIARELSENDELGAEYTYVNALKDENSRLRKALKEIAAKGEMTLICQPGSFGDSEEAYSTGAHSAFAQSAEIAQEALEAK